MQASWLGVLLFGLISAPIGHLGAENVEVLFTSGERAYGELVSEDDSDLVIIRKVCTRSRVISGQVTYPRRTVSSVTPVPSLMDLYTQLDKATADTYADQFSFAKWCFERGLQDQAFLHAKHLYDEDPTDEVSQDLLKELGYVQDAGQWVKEGAFASKHGLVNFEGRWLTPAQVELRKADLKAGYDASAGVEHEHTLENAIVNDQRRIKEDQARLVVLNKEITDAKQQNQANNQPPQRPGGQRNQAQQAAQPADTSSDDSDIDMQKKDVQKNLVTANKQLATDQAALEANKPEVEKLQATATAAHQAFLDTLPKDAADSDAAKAPAGKTPAGKPGADAKAAADAKDADTDK